MDIRYLLLSVNTFSGCTEAFTTKGETASIEVKKLIKEIIPRCGIPIILGSDNEPALVAQVIQELSKV